jgi:tRNA-dihydrouridine synthase B
MAARGVKNHLDLMIEFYGEYGIIIMRKHIVKYIHGFRNASKWREKLIRVSKKDEVYRLLDSLSHIDEGRE